MSDDLMRTKRLLVCLLAVLCLLLSGCTRQETTPTIAPTSTPTAAPGQLALTKYSKTFYDAFDTVTTVIGFAADEETFDRVFAQVEEQFLHYHRIFDGYNAYEGVHNLYEVNLHAAEGPAPAEPELIALLQYMKDLQPRLQGRVNVAMGAVLSLWHTYRQEGTATPPLEELQARAAHCNFDDVILDAEANTVFFADPELQLDLGAVAKGYTVEIVASWLLTSEMPSYIISAGGNVRAGLAPQDGRARWSVGIQDPDDALFTTANGIKDILYGTDVSVVSSGDYQRYYVVDGVRYHHIIDPDTLFPSAFMRQVTVVTQDSGYADALSTCLFLLPYEAGRAFVDSLEGVEAYWVLNDGSVQYTDGMAAMLGSLGASAHDF